MAREIANEQVGEELRDFALAAETPAEADPAFEEKLRERLWRMLRRRLGLGRDRERLD